MQADFWLLLALRCGAAGGVVICLPCPLGQPTTHSDRSSSVVRLRPRVPIESCELCTAGRLLSPQRSRPALEKNLYPGKKTEALAWQGTFFGVITCARVLL